MKSFKLKTLLVTLFSFSFFTACAQNNSSEASLSKELGINVRSLWFGQSAALIHRTQKSENLFIRKGISLSGTINEANNSFTTANIAGLPESFATDKNNNLSLNLELVREKRKEVWDDFHFYHGPSAQINYGFVNRRVAQGANNAPEMNINNSQSISLGLGYLGGIGFNINQRMLIQVENVLAFQARMFVSNISEESFDINSQSVSTVDLVKDRQTTTFGIPNLNSTRIWLIFKLK